MHCFLVLSFYLMPVVFVSGRIFSETSSLPRLRITRNNNHPQKIILWRPHAKQDQIEKIIYVKHLLELKCLKKIFDDIRNRNRFHYHQHHKMVKPLDVSPHQYPIVNLQKKKPISLPVEHQDQTNLNNRIIFLPPKGKFVEKQIYTAQNKISKLNGSVIVPNQKLENIIGKTPDIKFIHNSPMVTEKREEKFTKENPKVVTTDEDIPKAVTPGSYPKIYQKPISVKTTLPTHPVENSHLQQYKPIRPYDPSNRGRTTAILRTLTNSRNSSTKNTKQIFSNSPAQGSYLGTSLNNFSIFSNNDFLNLNKKTIENKSIVTSRLPISLREEQSKQLKITSPHLYEINKHSKESSTIVTTKSEIDTTTTVKVENIKSIFTNKVTAAPLDVFKAKKWSEAVEYQQTTTDTPEIQKTSEFFDDIYDLDLENVWFKDEEFNMTTFLPLTVTKSTVNDLTAPEETLTKNENSSNALITIPNNETSPTRSTKEVVRVEPTEKIIESSDAAKNTKKMDVEINLPEERLSMPIFKEFTDLPLTINLLTTIKKEQETVLKNSRKMHFNEETLTTTIPTQVTKPDDPQQRRSDILIDDNLDDYVFYDSSFTSNYLKQLKQKDFTNSSSDFIIQLIPFVINDLRENRISPQDIRVLSKAFGNYWTTVLALTNNTDIDMLPLLKMKNEKDLNNILETYFPGKSYLVATEMKGPDHDNYLGYYYDDDYKDLTNDQEDSEEEGENYRFKKDEKYSRYLQKVREEQN